MIFLCGQGKTALIKLKGSPFDKNAGIDGILDPKRVILVVSDCSESRPFRYIPARFADMCKFETFQADLIVLVLQVDDDGWEFLADQNTVR